MTMIRHAVDPNRTPAAIATRGLCKVYESDGVPVEALRGVDLNVPPGEFVAIMGPSGCGKSTLLHLLGGLDRPTSGEIHLAGERVDRLSEAKWATLRRRRIGFVFQFFNLIDNLTVADNVELPALLAGVPTGEARRRRMTLLDDLGIAGKSREVPGRLSGGEQQRVALARALINQPAVILADEPTGNLDSGASADVLRLLRQSHDQGQTIVLVTHDARVASAADRVLTMRDGRISDETRLTDSKREMSRVLSELIDLDA
ncbi:MAG: ABC transporter ATP-binding protein [Thermomicrobiales bacterium]